MTYRCADDTTINAPHVTFEYLDSIREEYDPSIKPKTIPRYGVMQKFDEELQTLQTLLFVCEMGLDREMSTILRGSENIRTVIFPGTVNEVLGATFEGNKLLESLILNEGLEKLEGY